MSRHRVIVVNRAASALRPAAGRPRRGRGPPARAAACASRERVGEHVGRRRDHERAPVGRAEHLHRRAATSRPRSASAAASTAASSPESSASAPNGGKPSAPAPVRLGVGDERGLPFHERTHDLVVGLAGLHDEARLVARPAREELRAARRQPVRLRRGPVARREQLLVEVEERDERRAAAAQLGPVQHRLGADHDVGVADLRGRGVDVEHAQPREQRGELLAHARDARAQHAQPRRAALVADHRPLGRRGPSAAARDTRRTRARGTGRAG